MDKKQREDRRRQEDKALNRGLLWVGGAILLELLLLFVKRWYVDVKISEAEQFLMMSAALRWARVAAAVAAAACLAWLLVRLRSGKSAALPTVLALVAGGLAVCAHVVMAYPEGGVQMLFLLVPAWAGLALVYYLYQREFFLAAAAAGMAAVGLWFIRVRGGICLEGGLAVLGVALVLAVTLMVRKENGVLSLAGVKLQVLPRGSSCTLALASCLASLAALLLAAVLGVTAAYYLIFVMAAWLFGLLVYYTVKMM